MATIAPERYGPNVSRFLDLLAFSEGTSTSPLTKLDGYDVIVSGIDGPEVFTDLSDHPFARGRTPKIIRVGPPTLLSTASGRYQLLEHFWPAYKRQLGLPDFAQLSQDQVAIQQIKERRALSSINSGDIAQAITLCSSCWASLPGNGYGQGGKSMEELLAHWKLLSQQA